MRRAALCLVTLVACGDGSSAGTPPDAAPDVTQGPEGATALDSGGEAGETPLPDTGGPSDSATVAPEAGTAIDADIDVSSETVETGGSDSASPSDSGSGCPSPLAGGPVVTTTMHLDIGVHDPSMIWDGSKYYLFATGGALGIRSSLDMLSWTPTGNVLPAIPAWITSNLGQTPGDLWAPDVSYFAGAFHIYYAGSTFGSNHSVIGLATNPALDPTNQAYRWSDDGLVVQSTSSDDFNAIDPNLSFDQNCQPWLAFGSFWSGIKLRKIDPTSGKLATDDTTTYSLASRNGGAIEASSIISHNGFFYLFVSFDACCKGTSSTYRTMVGRARAITGPYLDRAGNDMRNGAAEQLLATSGRYIGPGGGTAWKDGNTYLYVFHYYDGMDNGASKLQVRPIEFGSDDWVTLGNPLFP